MTTLKALPSQPHPWSALLTRPDLRWVSGILHLVHDDLTPEQAHVADIVLIADTLTRAGIDPLLVRDARRRPVIVVDGSDAARAHAALVARGADEPLYVKRPGSPLGLAADLDEIPARSASSLRLFRPRITSAGTMQYGLGQAVRLEIWHTRKGTVHAPSATALTRRVFAAADLVPATTRRYGRTWRTIAGMFDPQPDEVTADIDMVFSWVDGSSSRFQQQRAAQLQEYVVGGDEGPARYRHVDELKYALRSVHMYAPWVRRIFIATDSDCPAWLAEHPRVTIVRSEEFFADAAGLPTHNSHAVESQLHRIEGLAEHFLYSNDDMFFGRPVRPELFFTSGGISKFVECGVRIGSGPARLDRSGHDNALRVNRELLRERFGRTILRDLEHCATPLRRSVAAELEREFADDYARTAASRFRCATDISVTNSLYHYYALMTGRAIASTEPRVRYVQTTMSSAIREMERLERRDDIDMFCLNDGGDVEIPEDLRVALLRETLERMFPIAAPWERELVSAAPAAGASAAPRDAGR